MRIPLTLLCLLRIVYSTATAQSPDSIQISLSKNPAENSAGKRISAADGFYAIPAAPVSKFPALHGLVLIQPAKLIGRDSVLKITAYPELAVRAPYYEFQSQKYPGMTRQNFREYQQVLSRIVYTESLFESSGNEGVLLTRSTTAGERDTIAFVYTDATGRENRVAESYVKYESFLDRTDSIVRLLDLEYQRYRAAKLQPVVNELLTPFYISQTEISNNDYRKFVHWVADSLAFRILYDSLPPAEALQLLNCPKKERQLLDPAQKAANLARYSFNYAALDTRKTRFYGNEHYAVYLDSFYYPRAERFYQRLEVNVTKLIYQSATASPTPVYPDTLCWLRDSAHAFQDPIVNLYFWHPAYENYPVVGLSEAQMKAYCDWLTIRRNEELKDANYTVRFELPQLHHYELAVKFCTTVSRVNTIDAHPAIPFMIQRYGFDAMDFMSTVYASGIYPKQVGSESQRKFYDWQRANQTFPIFYLSGGVAEYCSMPDSGDSTMTVLGGDRLTGLVDPNENQLNTAFFQRKVAAAGGSSTTGFRTVLYIVPKR